MVGTADCCWCDREIEFPALDPPDICPHCGHQLEWDWHDDPEGRPPLFLAVRSEEQK